jgi:hypothetical protein
MICYLHSLEAGESSIRSRAGASFARMRVYKGAKFMMDRRSFSTALVGGIGAFALPERSEAQAVARIRNVVLVHGLYADGSCLGG